MIPPLVTFIAFKQVRQNEFTSADNIGYVADSPHVKVGLTRESIVWAFTAEHALYGLGVPGGALASRRA